jgi:DNA-binding NarL/FixJ family response regulator
VGGSPQRTAVVYDPHPLWLDGVRHVLDRVGVQVLDATTDEARAADLVRRLQPDLLVTTSADLLAARGGNPGLRTVMLASTADPAELAGAFAAGATAYVLKTAHPDDLATAVRQVFTQTVYTVSRSAHGLDQADEELEGLTRREREILALVAEGLSNADVAGRLWVSRQTVKFHLGGVYRKLGVANRTEAARWAHDHGLLAARATAAA